jgi:hypothetical protein
MTNSPGIEAAEATGPHGHAGALLPVATFTGAYLFAATLIALGKGNSEFLLYIAVMLMLVLAVWLVHRVVLLSSAVLWSLSVWGLLHMAGGLIAVPDGWPVDGGSQVLYSLWLMPGLLKFDHLVHAYGFGVATWVCWQGLRAAIDRRGGDATPTLGLMLLTAIAGMGLGAANELVEFVATILFPSTNVGGYVNTGWDLFANMIGATCAVTIIGSRRHSRVT